MNRSATNHDSHTTLQEGQLRTGVVKSISNFGATVQLEGGVMGIVHISEITWNDINHPSEIVSVGDEVRFTILKISTKHQRLWLSMKATEEHPWDIASERYSVGTVVTGTVVSLVNYGAFVELEKWVEGLLHMNEISQVIEISHPSEVLTKDQKVKCRILAIDRERRRMSLGVTETEEGLAHINHKSQRPG